jgi:hypothetical protein
VQLELCTQPVAHALPLHPAYGAQLFVAPAVHMPVPLQVPAMVSCPLLHEAAAQSALVLHCTQPVTALQAPGQVCWVPATQVLAVQVYAGVNVLPLHEAAGQSALVLHCTQVFVVVSQTEPAVQSVVALHWTHSPLPLQTLPLLSVHAVPADASDVPHMPMLHVATMHSVLGVGQSVGSVHVPPELLLDVVVVLVVPEELVVVVLVVPPMPEELVVVVLVAPPVPS